MKTKKWLIISLLVLIEFVVMIWIFMPNKSEWDVIDKENPKLVAMANEQFDRLIENHTKSSFYPGYNEHSHINAQKFFNSLRSAETYARHGVMSTKSRNNIYLKLEFNNGEQVKKVYTSKTATGIIGPTLMLKYYFENGKIKQVFTNGVELDGSPDWVKNDLYDYLYSTLGYDIQLNWNDYFEPSKTKSDYKKEWEELETK